MKIIAGLGNYGDKYAYTFHNMGFLTAECLADRLGLKFKKRECDSLIAEGNYKGERIIIAKPLTYMNLSGAAVKQLLRKNNCDPSSLIVIFDDIDIEKGTVRKRLSGSGGTHNGMRNIIDAIGTGEFARVRVGVGKPPEFVPLADYVLSEVPKAERQLIADAIEKAADEVLLLVEGKVTA